MRKFDGMKRLLVLLLAFSMVLSCVPVTVLASEGDACAVTPECTGVYVEGVCSVCGEEEPVQEHIHVYDGGAVYTQKDDNVHTVTRACTACEEKPTQTVDEPHVYTEGVCVCGKTEPVPVDEAVEAVAALIDALPSLEEIQAKPMEEQGEDYNQVNAAYDAYGKLTEEQKALLPPAEDVFKPYFDYFSSQTEEAATSGTCGSQLTWILNDEGTLTISGTGAIPNSALPWEAYKDQIKSIVIGDGIETIYQSAFSNYTNLTSVSLPDTMVIIGQSAFSGCSSLTSITIPTSVTTIGDSAFADTGLTSVEYEGVKCPSGSNSVFPATVTQVTVPNRYDGTTFCGVNVKCAHPDCTPGNHTWEHGARDDDCFVSFNMKGHGEAIADKRVPKDDNTEAPTAPVAAGYAFGGWYTDEACTNAFDFATSITANITLYAKWTEAEASWYVGETLTGSGTFDQAVAAVNGGSGVTKIQLFKNVDCNGAYFVAGTTVTLELNGKTITRKSGYIGVKNNLTIQDSSSEKTGTIDSIVDEYYACMVVTDNGHLTIQSGNYKNGGTVGAISIESANASCTINGGDFTVGYFQVANYNGTLTINGGSFTPIPLGYSIFVGSKTTIYNATFHSTGLPAIGYSGGELIFVDSVPANTRLKNPGTLAITDPDITLPAGYVIKDENGNEATVLLPDGPVDSSKIYSIEKAAYSVIVTNDGNGTGIATPASGAAGTEITLTATPNSGYKFKEWQVISGGVTVANNKFTIGTSDVEVKAIFEKDTPETPSEPTTYNINIDGSITDGTVVADKTEAAAGETVILTVTPANGYALDTLKVNNEAVTVANNKYTLTMPAGDVTVTAIFKSVFTPVAEVTAAGTTTQYASLETALEEAAEFSDGATVKLLQNIPNQNEAIVVTGGKITLNLNGKTITDTMTSAEQCYVLQFTGGTHTIQGGTIVGAVQTYGESKVTFASGTITSGQKFTVMAEGNSTLQVSGGTISNTRTQNGSGVALAAASNSKVVTKGSINAIYMALHAAGASEVSVSGGSLTGGTAGIYVDGDSQVAISDGSVSSPQGRAIWTFGGATSVTGGTFSSSLDVRKTDGTVTLSGGTFMGGIKVESAMLKDILADGCNYYLNDQIVNITADQTEITGGDVVVKRSVTGVSLDKTSLNLVVGQKEKLNATVSPDLATNKKLIWISGDETVATVDEAGEVTAKGAGETTITVTTEDGNFTASCKVEVVAEYPVWVAGTRVTSENMDNVLGDGTVSYDPIAKKLTLSGDIRCDKESTTAIATTYGVGVTLTIAGSGTISASSGSGIYTNKANVKLTGGPFTINGTSYGIYLGEGDLFVDGAKVKATTNDTTKNGVLTYTGVEIMENDGGLLAVTGTKAVVRGSYTMDVETFEELWVAQGAALTISSGETVEVKDKINSSGIIKINGTLKVPAGSGRKTMSGGILYIGTKGYKWDEMAKVYRCLEHDWTYRLKTGTTDTVEAYCEECQSTSSDVLTISKPTREVYNDQGNGNASLNDYSASVFTNVGEIRYQEKGGGTAIERPLTDAGTYIASVTVGSGENTVTASVEYTIAPRPVTLRVTLKTNSKVYDGTTTAEVDTVTPEGVIRADKEVVVQYGAANYNSPNVADATEVRFTGWGLTGNRSENYVLSAQPASVSATITAKSLKDVQATLSDNVIFNGQPVPELTVKDGDTTLEKDKDYTVSQTGSNGEFTMTITGMGNYQDVATDKPTYLVVTLPDPDKVEPDDKSAIDAYDRYVEWNQKYQDAELKKALEEILKALTDYDVIKGHKSSYTRGSSKKVSFTANGYFGKFVELKVDGKTLDPKCYTAKSGSTIVTFKNSYLNSLSDGKHDVRFVYVDGSTDGDDYFRIATNNGSPFTGDDNHLLMMTGIMMTSLMCIVIMVMCVPRKKGKYQR